MNKDEKNIIKVGKPFIVIFGVVIFSFLFLFSLDFISAGFFGYDFSNLGKGSTITTWTGNLTNLSQLSDVNIPTPSNNEILTYDSATNKWLSKVAIAGTELDPYWSDNFTLYNSSWTSTYNSTYDAYNNTGLIINWSGDYLTEETLWNANYSSFLTISAWNDTGLIRNWNATGLIKDWSGASELDPYWSDNFTLYNTSWSYYEVNTDNWNTTSDIWNVIDNNSFYSRLENEFGYYNSTNPITLDAIGNPLDNKTFSMANKQLKFTYQAPQSEDGGFEIEATGGFIGDLVHIHQHTGNPGLTDLLHLEAEDVDVLPLRVTGSNGYAINITNGALWVKDYINSTSDICLTDGTCLSTVGASELDPYWSDNFTLYNSSWTSTYNSTYDAYNNTGLIIDWNFTNYIINWNDSGYIMDWNSTGLIINWSGDYLTTEYDPYWSDNFTLYNSSWTYYEPNTDSWNTTGEIWDVINNQSFALINEPLWSGNSTNLQVDCPAGNYSYGMYANGTSKCRSDLTGAAAEADPYWSDNFTLYNTSWTYYEPNTDSWNTTGEIWNVIDNSTFYSRLDDEYAYYNSTDFSIDDYLLEANQTLLGNYSASVDFCIAGGGCLSNSGASESDPYWSDNFTLYNSSWTYYEPNTDSWNTTGEIWDVINNQSFALINEPLWSENFSLYNASWSSAGTELDPYWSDNFTLYNTSWSYYEVDTDTWNTSIEMFNAVNNGTFAYINEPLWSENFSLYNASWSSAGTELDPYWSDNFTLYNTSWGYYEPNTDSWNTTSEIWNVIDNSTFYSRLDDEYGYYNSTDFDINDYLLETNQSLAGNYSATVDFCIADGSCLSNSGASESDPYWSDNFTLYNSSWTSTYNSTYDAYNNTGLIIDWNISNWIINWNASTFIRNWNATGLIKDWSGASELDPYWSDNFTLYNSSWTTTDSEIWNVIDNSTFYSRLDDEYGYYNSTDFSIDDYYLKTNPFSFYNLTTWANPYAYWNSTFATFNKTYADTLYSTIDEPLWNSNSSLVPYLASANVFVENQTMEGIKLEGDTTNHVIYDNATCIYIKGDTSTLEIC